MILQKLIIKNELSLQNKTFTQKASLWNWFITVDGTSNGLLLTWSFTSEDRREAGTKKYEAKFFILKIGGKYTK